MSSLQKPKYLNTESVCVNGQWSLEQMWKNIKGKSKSTKILNTPPSPTLSAPFPIPYLHSLKFEIKQPYFIGHLTFMSQWRVYGSFTVAQTGFPAPAPWPHATQQQPVRHPASPRPLPRLAGLWGQVAAAIQPWSAPQTKPLFCVCLKEGAHSANSHRAAAGSPEATSPSAGERSGVLQAGKGWAICCQEPGSQIPWVCAGWDRRRKPPSGCRTLISHGYRQ